ncbi:Metallo-beta-lactamase superfamily protein [Mycena kentingensis (nom. inval.)]|nr:Metallo-beta-lactamase superfamily protein [Mycena kentingensis (nom. inval.)]
MIPQALFVLFAVCSAFASFHDFGIPEQSATVDVRAFNVGNLSIVGAASAVFSPTLPGHESVTLAMHAFLVEHPPTKTRLMFDLGLRKDVENFPSAISSVFDAGVFAVNEEKDITQLLVDGGVPLETIDTVIWSHAHFDHIGDMSKFPNTTRLVMGSETDTSIYPANPNATLQASDLVGRNVTKIDFSKATLEFSGLAAIDYFGDGSFYLMSTPGHFPGHITALARVSPSSFVLLGGDTFHNPGELRPRPAFQRAYPCPADILALTRSSISTDFFWSPRSQIGRFDLPSRAQQLLAISDEKGAFVVYTDPAQSQVSLEKIATFDADADFFVLIAHDASVVKELPYFPRYLNGWKESGVKNRTAWRFVEKSSLAFVFGEK